MKKSTFMLGALAILGLTFASCSQEPVEGPAGEGKQGVLMLNLNGKTNFTSTAKANAMTRALNEADYNNVGNYDVVVTNKNGTPVLTCKGSQLKDLMPLTMPIGNYTVKASYGKEAPASRNEFYVEGIGQGMIQSEGTTNATVNCTPTCGRIKVNFSPEMANYFSDYHVSFGGTKALGVETISWLKSDVEPWYIKLEESGETVSFTITTVTKNEFINSSNKQQTATKTGSFILARNKAYKMTVNPKYTPTANGNVGIEITIDESTNDHPVDIEIPIEWI